MGSPARPNRLGTVTPLPLVHGPRTEQNHAAPTELIQSLWQDAGALSITR